MQVLISMSKISRIGYKIHWTFDDDDGLLLQKKTWNAILSLVLAGDILLLTCTKIKKEQLIFKIAVNTFHYIGD